MRYFNNGLCLFFNSHYKLNILNYGTKGNFRIIRDIEIWQ